MNEDELTALVEARLAERLAARERADRERVRWEVILELRREADRAHHARINARHPIESKLAGLTPEQEAQRQADMAARTKASGERMDRANHARVAGQVARSLRPTRADSVGGASGFVIK
jgi:hypothetical protein